MNYNDREKIIQLTPLWKGERLPDGRPKVEDKYLDALYSMTLEEVWKPIFVLGYEHQFVGGGVSPMHALHNDDRKGQALLLLHITTCPNAALRTYEGHYGRPHHVQSEATLK